MAITFSVDKQVLPPANDSSTRDDIDELLYEQLLKRVSNTHPDKTDQNCILIWKID